MVGLVPTIHAFALLIERGVQDVDARHKGEHDELENRRDSSRARRLRGAPGYLQCPLPGASVIRSTQAMPNAEKMKMVWISVCSSTPVVV
jgi:hypothetical protein